MVIHGTDTMAFAASVLSFVLENLQKTVVLTGAQVTSQPGARGSVVTEAAGRSALLRPRRGPRLLAQPCGSQGSSCSTCACWPVLVSALGLAGASPTTWGGSTVCRRLHGAALALFLSSFFPLGSPLLPLSGTWVHATSSSLSLTLRNP